MSDFITVFEKIADNANQRVLSEREPEDYIGNDDLLYCGKCHAQKQCRTVLGNHVFVCGCMCKCEKIQYEREEEQRKLRERVDFNTSRAHIPDVFRNAEYSKIENLEHRKFAYNYAHKFAEVGKRGLLLYGDVGTGKSYMASCIAHQLLKMGYSVKWTTTLEFVDKGSFFNRDDYNSYVDSITIPDLVIIDDLGAERNTDFAVERVQEMIDRRSASNKPMIITTNLDVNTMMVEQNIGRKRTYDRVLESCYPILFRGQSYRLRNANNNFSDFGKLLSE